jgi:hypothetical protein
MNTVQASDVFLRRMVSGHVRLRPAVRMGGHQGRFGMRKSLLAVLLSLSLVFFPARNSNAFLPILGVALGYTATGATLTAGVETAVMGALALIGITAAFFTMTAADGSKVAVPMVPGAGGAAPAPIAPATSAQAQHLDPSVTYTVTDNGASLPHACGGSGLSFAAACAATACVGGWTQVSNNGGAYSAGVNSIVDYTCTYWAGGYTNQQMYGATSLSCSAGYVVSGSSCVLSDARLVTQDNRQDVSRNGNVMSVTLGDLHGALSANVMTTTTSNDTVSVSGTGTNGQPMQTNFVATPSGTTILQSQQMSDPAGSTYVQTVTATVDLNGTVTSASQSSSNASLQPDPANPSSLVPVSNPSGSISASPAATGGGFPNDYARTGEAAAAAATTNARLDTLHHDLSDTATVADPLAVDPATMTGYGTTFDNLKAWNLPAHVSTCPAPDIDLSGVFGAGHVYHFNAHCQLVQDHFAALQAAMMVCWSLMAMFVVLRA